MEQLNEFIKGLNQDNEPTMQPEGTWSDAQNIRIVNNDSNSYRVESLYSTGNDSDKVLILEGTPIGYCSILNAAIVFLVKNGISYIEYIVYSELTKEFNVYTILKSAELNFSASNPIRAIGNFENNETLRVYWTDNNNAPRVINIKEFITEHIVSGSLLIGETYIVRGGGITWNGNQYSHGDTFTIGGADPLIYTSNTSFVLVNVYDAFNIKLLDLQPQFFSNDILFETFIPGNLIAGLYSYVFRYVDKKQGIKLPWSLPNLFVPIYVANQTVIERNEYQEIQGNGANVATITSKGVRLKINDIDTSFSSIELAVIQFTAYNVVGARYVFTSQNITGSSMTFNHTGEVNLENLTLDDMVINPVPIKTAKDLDTVDNILFYGNIKERNELTLPLDCSSFATIDELDILIPGDSRPFESFGAPTIPPYFGHRPVRNQVSGIYNLVSGQLYYVGGAGSVKVYSSAGTEIIYSGSYFRKYGPGDSTLNVPFTNADAQFYTDDVTAEFNSGTPSILAVIGDETLGKHIAEYRINDLGDYKGVYANSYAKGYFKSETYRIGILFYDKKNNPYLVRWIGDYTFDSITESNGLIVNGGLNNERTVLKVPHLKVSIGDLKTWLNVGTDNEVYEFIGGFSIVRAARDEQILGQGILYPTSTGGREIGVNINNNNALRLQLAENMSQDVFGINEMYNYAAEIAVRKYPDANRKIPFIYQMFCSESLFLTEPNSISENDYLRLEGYLTQAEYTQTGESQRFNIGNSLGNQGSCVAILRAMHFIKKFNKYVALSEGAYNSVVNNSAYVNVINADSQLPKANGYERKIKNYWHILPTGIATNTEYDVPTNGFTSTAIGHFYNNKLISGATTLGLVRVLGYDNTPPFSPSNGDFYIINTAPTGAWANHQHQIAIYDTVNSAWKFFDPAIGDSYFESYTDTETFVAYVYEGTTNGWIRIQGFGGFTDIYTQYRGNNSNYLLPISQLAFEKSLLIALEDDGNNDLSEKAKGTNGFGAFLHMPHLRPIVSIVRKKGELYGGQSTTALENTVYYLTGHYQKVNNTTGVVFNDIIVGGGDAYTQYIDATRFVSTNIYNRPTSDYDIFTTQYSEQKEAYHGVIFPVQSKYNFTLRQGRHVARDGYDLITSNAITGTAGQAYGSLIQDEERIINKAYSSDATGYSFASFITSYRINRDFPARVRYSLNKIAGEIFDSYRQFLENNLYDMNLNLGPINGLRFGMRNLYVWQENGVSSIPINQRVMISDNLGGELQLGAGRVIDQHSIISDTIGTQHMFSICKSNSTFVWFDLKTRTYCRIRFGSGIEELSIIKGLHQFFHNYFNDNLLNATSDNYYNKNGILTEYNDRYKEFVTYFAFNNGTDNLSFSYNEKIDGFVSFLTQYPEFVLKANNRLVYYDIYIPEESAPTKIWLEYEKEKEFLNYFNRDLDSSLEIIINQNRNTPKIFDNFVIVTGSLDMLQEVTTSTDLHIGLDNNIDSNNLNYRFRNQAIYSSVPRDITDESRMRDYYMRSKFIFKGYIKRIITKFRQAF